MLLRGAARTDEGPYGYQEATGNAGDNPGPGQFQLQLGYQEATGNAGDNPANRDKDRTKEKAGKEGGTAGRPARWKVPPGGCRKCASGKSP